MKMKKMISFPIISVLLLGFFGYTSFAFSSSTTPLCELNCVNRFGWQWSLPELVSEESTSHSYVASIAPDPYGNIHVVYDDDSNILGSGGDTDIFYKRWNITSAEWTGAEVVSSGYSYNSFYSELAVDLNGDVHVVWHDENSFDIIYRKLDYSTYSWSSPVNFTHGWDSASTYPNIVADSHGNIHVVWQDNLDYLSSDTDYDIHYKKWDVDSASWMTTEVITIESTSDSLNPSIDTDGDGNIHVCWEDKTDYSSAGTDRDVFYKFWDSVSETWSTTEVVSLESTADCYDSAIDVDLAGNVHISWSDSTDLSSGTDFDIFYKRKSVHSKLWTSIELVSSECSGDSWDSYIITDDSGSTHIFWTDQTNDYAGSGSDSDIFYKRLDNSFSSWTTAQVVSTTSTSSSSTPYAFADALGIIHLVWDDYTNNLLGSGSDVDIFYKRFSGSPTAPEISFILPNPDEDGVVDIIWNNVYGASDYYLYRSDAYIFSVDGLEPIQKTADTQYTDTLPATGYYYYVVVAENFAGNSSQSDCQYIEYKLPSMNEFAITFGIIGGFAVIFVTITTIRKRRNDSHE